MKSWRLAFRPKAAEEGDRQGRTKKKSEKNGKNKKTFFHFPLSLTLSPSSTSVPLRSLLCMLLARTGAGRARASTLKNAAKIMLLQGGLASRNAAFSSERAAVAALSSSTCPCSAAFLRSFSSASCSGRRAMVTSPASFAASATARRKNSKASAAAAEIDAPVANGVVSELDLSFFLSRDEFLRC